MLIAKTRVVPRKIIYAFVPDTKKSGTKAFFVGADPRRRRGIARQASLVVDYGKLVDADEESTVAEQAAPFGSADAWEVY